MRLLIVVGVISFLCLTTTMALAISLSKSGCQEKCGNVTIPYPFGIGSECSANSSFTVTCDNSTNPPTPFLSLSGIRVEVANISQFGAVVVNYPVSPLNCSGGQKKDSVPISLKGSPFTLSAHYNILVVLGCKNSVWLRANRTTTIGGCTAACETNSSDTSCNGVNCCQIIIPTRLQEFEYTYQSVETSNNGSCGYAFPVDKKWLEKEDYKAFKGLLSDLSNPFDHEFGFAPLVLEWEFFRKNQSYSICRSPEDYSLPHPISDYYRRVYFDDRCTKSINDSGFALPDDYCHIYPDHYCCQSLLDSHSEEALRHSFYYNTVYDYVSWTEYCSCRNGFEGNPYLPEGCSDIDECMIDGILYGCPPDATCENMPGHYRCRLPGNNNKSKSNTSRTKIKIFISIGSTLGGLILLIGAWKSAKAIRKMIEANRKRKFFKRNGGLLLEQQLSSTDNGLEKTKFFSSKELTRATDHYNESRILGRGGQGTVYKGMLTDGRIVAVKKSKKVEEGDLEVFINEVVIVSQINHRNVVKLLGCCLETEVPLLVYEFIPNGTLFQHIHDPSEEFPLSWEMRVRIAREVAGALAYLHSAASTPIYHRDIKSTNILLDDKYRAKVSDFGTSRSVAIDQTHLTTRVLGTFGYLDPEYFQSSQFTEKSDVYSFGVVMVELLTGEKAISSIRAEVGRSLATYFLHSMEEGQLFGILDARVLREGKREEIVAIAELARRCLHLNGKRRPTMKEVAVELEGIQMLKDGSNFPQNQGDNRECYSVEVADQSYNFSSISESMDFDSITQCSKRR